MTQQILCPNFRSISCANTSLVTNPLKLFHFLKSELFTLNSLSLLSHFCDKSPTSTRVAREERKVRTLYDVQQKPQALFLWYHHWWEPRYTHTDNVSNPPKRDGLYSNSTTISFPRQRKTFVVCAQVLTLVSNNLPVRWKGNRQVWKAVALQRLNFSQGDQGLHDTRLSSS